MSNKQEHVKNALRDSIVAMHLVGDVNMAEIIGALLSVAEELVTHVWVDQGESREALEKQVKRIEDCMMKFLPEGFQANTGVVIVAMIRSARRTVEASKL